MEQPSAADKEVGSKELIDIYTKLGDLEQHIVNLIHPIQSLNRLAGGPERTLENFIRLFKDPIKIDDRDIVKSMNEFKASMDIYSQQMNLKALISAFMDISTMKLMIEAFNQRLSNMEHVLFRIEEKGLEVKFSLNEKKIEPEESQDQRKKKIKRFAIKKVR